MNNQEELRYGSIPVHQRTGAEPSTPSARIMELLQIVTWQRQEIAELRALLNLIERRLAELDQQIN